MDCQERCSCGVGEQCEAGTGACLPCPAGRWGKDCAETCKCSQPGTALCSHQDGRCYCQANWFGPQCEQHCRFGYLAGVCYSQPINQTGCRCPNHLYSCTLELGCVCPPDTDCGLERLDTVVQLAPYSDQTASSSTPTIALAVLLLAGVAILLVVVYYRRRVGVMKRDLRNRSVYWERDTPDPDPEPQQQLNTLTNTVTNTGSGPNLLNNVRITLDSQRIQNATVTRSQKNTNQENTLRIETDEAAAAEADLESAGAVGGISYNINVFTTDEKSNIKSQFHNKAVKDLEVMIRNDLADEKDKKEDNCDADSISKLKVNLSKNGSSD